MLKGLKESYRNDAVYQVLLQKEYEITSQLQYPMVVSVFSVEEVEGFGPCIVMEWIEGLTLKEWLAQGNHSRKQRRHVADMLLEALAYVQSRQTQHRDLKPSNIMLTHDGQHLKLIDFGLSDTDSHTILKAPAGTEGYMAPDEPSDIYSLGRILRELRLGWLSLMVSVNVVRQVIDVILMLRPSREICTVAGNGQNGFLSSSAL
jgi:serine/threonine protein kinase